jgi:Na+/proline symporter
VGLAGSGFAIGMAVGGFEWMAVFFFGVLWKRITTKAVLACVSTGFLVGPILMLESYRHFLPFMQAPVLRPWLHGAILEFLVCVIVLVGVSLATAPMPKEKLVTTTLAWAGPNQHAVPRPRSGDYRMWLGLVVAITAAMWYSMR